MVVVRQQQHATHDLHRMVSCALMAVSAILEDGVDLLGASLGQGLDVVVDQRLLQVVLLADLLVSFLGELAVRSSCFLEV